MNISSPMGTQCNKEQLSSNPNTAQNTVLPILFSISFCHLLNDIIQSLIPAIYPILKTSFHLSFTQIGLITLTFQLTASLLQPFVGLYIDHRPKPYSLAIGMGLSLVGLIMLSVTTNFPMILVSVTMVGMGSSIFHPEASRITRMASSGHHSFAQSLFQVGGNAGTSFGPLLAYFVIVPHGQSSIAWFVVLALLAIIVLINVGNWYRQHLFQTKARSHSINPGDRIKLSPNKVAFSLAILIALIFSKYFYLASMTSYYTFYLIHKFQLPVKNAEVFLFIFLFAVAAGTIIGGPISDRFGQKYVIWVSILGVAPFTLLLPYANLFWTAVLTVVIGVILASAFPTILVYAQELVPGKVGTISGLFFGLVFGMGGIGSAALGNLADHTSITYVYHVCSFLPLIGLLVGFLPNLERKKATCS